MSRRQAIAMSPDEVRAFLDERPTLTCATLGPRGWPHLMPLWYVVRAGECWAWTYAKSQKVRNLERDPRCTLQVEAGTEYFELRGVMLECECALHREVETVAALGAEISARYGGQLTPEVIERQAPKRVALQFRERRRASWDHRKLAGTY